MNIQRHRSSEEMSARNGNENENEKNSKIDNNNNDENSNNSKSESDTKHTDCTATSDESKTSDKPASEKDNHKHGKNRHTTTELALKRDYCNAILKHNIGTYANKCILCAFV